VCLLVVISRVFDEWPLIVGANRDELFERAAVPMAVLSTGSPRVLGGRDELAGGTWLAVNECGLVAALTNRPAGTEGRDPTKRSRGELPLLLSGQTAAARAVDVLRQHVRPSDFNPAWMLVGDRSTLSFLDVTGEQAAVEDLGPGVHILENRPLGAPSPKVDHVRALLQPLLRGESTDIVKGLHAVLSNHDVPPGAELEERPLPVASACVHGERYGTRWTGIVLVPASPEDRPRFVYSDGPSCTNPLRDAPAW